MSKRLRKVLLVLLATAFCAVLFAIGCTSVQDDGKHMVTFNYVTSQIPTEKISVDDGSVLSEPEMPVREGYTFVGWATDIVGANMYDFSAPVEDDLRLFAIWEQNVATVTFMLQDGTVFATQKVNIGEKVIAPAETPSEEGYAFDSWCLTANGVYAYDFDAPVTGDFTLYATWKQTHATVTFALYGEVVIVEHVDLGTPVSAPEGPVRTDYAFSFHGLVFQCYLYAALRFQCSCKRQYYHICRLGTHDGDCNARLRLRYARRAAESRRRFKSSRTRRACA